MKRKLLVIGACLVLTFALTACGGGAQLSDKVAESNDSNPIKLEIIASNWEFDQETYTVPKGQPIEFSIVNEQGIHGYEIKGLGIRIDAKGSKQYIINDTGTYDIVCSIMCGSGHRSMKSKLIVE